MTPPRSSETSDVLLLTEAGEEIGLGHLMRCTAIASSFLQDGHNVEILCQVAGSLPHLDTILVSPRRWRDADTDLEALLRRADIAIVDSYLADASLYERISANVQTSAAIDDYERIAYPTDLVINPNPYAESMSYARQNAPVVGGADFVILRPDFRDHRHRHRVDETCRDIFLTVGGDDVRHLILPLSESLLSADFRVEVAAGDRAPELRSRWDPAADITIHGFLDAAQMLDRMCAADVTVSAAGQTLHELAFLGVPTVAVCVGEDQNKNLDFYVGRGFLGQHLYWQDERLDTLIIDQLQSLEPKATRQRRSRRAHSLIDGQGVERIRETILER